MKKNQIVWFPEVRKAEIMEKEIPVLSSGQYLNLFHGFRFSFRLILKKVAITFSRFPF